MTTRRVLPRRACAKTLNESEMKRKLNGSVITYFMSFIAAFILLLFVLTFDNFNGSTEPSAGFCVTSLHPRITNDNF